MVEGKGKEVFGREGYEEGGGGLPEVSSSSSETVPPLSVITQFSSGPWFIRNGSDINN